jgi:hypothetical protein
VSSRSPGRAGFGTERPNPPPGKVGTIVASTREAARDTQRRNVAERKKAPRCTERSEDRLGLQGALELREGSRCAAA